MLGIDSQWMMQVKLVGQRQWLEPGVLEADPDVDDKLSPATFGHLKWWACDDSDGIREAVVQLECDGLNELLKTGGGRAPHKHGPSVSILANNLFQLVCDRSIHYWDGGHCLV